jgi:hypothetical protein
MTNVGGTTALNISLGNRPDADVVPTLISGERQFIRVLPPLEAFRDDYLLRKVAGGYCLSLDPDSASVAVIFTLEFEDFAKQRYFVRERITPQSYEIIDHGKL